MVRIMILTFPCRRAAARGREKLRVLGESGCSILSAVIRRALRTVWLPVRQAFRPTTWGKLLTSSFLSAVIRRALRTVWLPVRQATLRATWGMLCTVTVTLAQAAHALARCLLVLKARGLALALGPRRGGRSLRLARRMSMRLQALTTILLSLIHI